jgi:hypothetical protein
LLGPDPRLVKERIYRAAVLQTLRNTSVESLAYRPAMFWGVKILFVRVCLNNSLVFKDAFGNLFVIRLKVEIWQ